MESRLFAGRNAQAGGLEVLLFSLDLKLVSVRMFCESQALKTEV
jgi:hypothetical protein